MNGSAIGLLLATTALIATATPAFAAKTHVPLPFSPIEGSSTGVTLHLPSGIAVDETSGNLFLNDGTSEGNVTDIFGAEGGLPAGVASPYQITGFAFGIEPSGVAVDNSAASPSKGTLYVVDVGHSAVKKYTLDPLTETYEAAGELTASPAFFEPLGDAVDSHGNVFVADYGSSSVVEFSPTGSELARIDTSTALGHPSSIALDSAGDLFVQSYSGGHVLEYPANGSGEIESEVFTQILPVGSGATGVAIDTAANVLYVALGDHVNEYDAGTLALRGEFGASSVVATTRLAVNSTTGVIYVSDNGLEAKRLVAFGPTVTLPDVVSGEATTIATLSATLTGTVNPDEIALTDCHFEYTDEADFQANGYSGPDARSAPCVPDAASIPADATVHSVTADAAGLSPNTTYRFRLVAANENGSNHGQDQTFLTRSAPLIDGESVADVSSNGALLQAEINPLGAATTYRFEFGTTLSYGTNVPVSDASIGAGSSDVAVSQQLTGLQPSTTYHFRVVAVNSFGTTEGPDRTFVTYPPAPSGLPDGRAYELVTPPSTGGNAIGTGGSSPVGEASVSTDGEHVRYVSYEAFADASNGLTNNYVANRGPSGWTTTAASLPPGTPHPGLGNIGELKAASPDYSRLLFSTSNPIDPADQNGVGDVYSLALPDRTASWISQNGEVATQPIKRFYAGSSTELGHVLFATREHLTFDDSAQVGGFGLYERSGSSTRLVGIKTDGSLISTCGAILGDVQFLRNSFGTEGEETPLAPGAYPISADGSRVFLESPTPRGGGDSDPSCLEPVEVYLRENAETTTEISLSRRTGEAGTPAPDGATFLGATPDGSFVFFSSPDRLTDDATPPGSTEQDLYRYDVGSGALTFLAPAFDGQIFKDRGGDPMISTDGSRVYFRGSVAGEGPAGLNLYLWDRGAISFVSHDPQGGPGEVRDARTSSDGSVLAFTANNLPPAREGKGQIYLYREATGSLACVSCDPNGIPPTGNAAFMGIGNESALGFQLSSNLVLDGKRLFFDSSDPLLPQATNGLYNVYEWEADGTGSCHSDHRSGGCLYLISNGDSSKDSLLLGASADGRDVVFATVDRLTPQDLDPGEYSLYDARIGGGFPYNPPPVPCSAEACRGVFSAPPAGEPLGSVAFSGAGNPAAQPAAPAAQPAAKVKPLTRAQKLSRARKACKKQRQRKRRASCEARARKRYGARSKAKRAQDRKGRAAR